MTGVHADVREAAEEGVRHDLERERREGLLAVGVAQDDRLFVLRVVRLDGGHVERRREVVHDRVEHRLHAAVLERRAAEHGVDLRVDGQLADGGLDLGDREGLAAEVLLEQVLVRFGDGLEQDLAVLRDDLGHVGRDLLDVVLGAHGHVALGVARPDQRAHLDQVDDADEVVLDADRQLQHERLGLELVDDRVDREVEVGAELVHLVDEADARDVVLVGLTPDGLGLGLDALLAVEDGDRAIEHAKRALDLDREVDVAGGVDDVDLVLVPEARHGSGGDRDATLLLLLHPVGGRGAVVRLTDLVVGARVVQDALGRRRLAGIDVRHDADVADLREVGEHVLCHGCLPYLWSPGRSLSLSKRPGVRRSAPQGAEPGRSGCYQR